MSNIAPELLDLTHPEKVTISALSISSSSFSIICGFSYSIIIYAAWRHTWRLNLKDRNLRFRVHIISFLVGYDFLKAVLFLVFSTLTLHTQPINCSAAGFFQSLTSEGGDFTNLALALHSATTIFLSRPSGLAPYRKIVFILLLVIPLVLASLAFVNPGNPFDLRITLCALPMHPRWYSLALNWIPRFFILGFVIVVYCAIYVYVVRQFALLQKELRGLSKEPERVSWVRKSIRAARESVAFIWLIFGSEKSFYRYEEQLEQKERAEATNDVERGKKEPGSAISSNSGVPNSVGVSPGVPADLSDLTAHVHRQTLQSFLERKKRITSQTTTVLLYPLSYTLLWVFPLVLYIKALKNPESVGGLAWLWAVSAWMRPFNCTLDVAIFVLREVVFATSDDRRASRAGSGSDGSIAVTDEPAERRGSGTASGKPIGSSADSGDARESEESEQEIDFWEFIRRGPE